MWIHLIDADSKIPNVALMKISAYHKAQGAFVTISKGDSFAFFKRLPDKVYISIIFRKNAHVFDGIRARYPNIVLDIGGSGYDLKKELPPEIEAMKPDYSLYPEFDYSINFSSRGCIRSISSCPWCIVPVKEGKFRLTQHPKEWYNEKSDKIVFLDNNILSDEKYFVSIVDWCTKRNLAVWFTQGLDIRKLSEVVATKLLTMKTYKSIFFAWDNINDEEVIRRKVALLKKSGFTDAMCRAKIQFYVYIDNDSDEEYESGVYRCRELKKLSCNAFVMYNIDNPATQRIINLRRWANRKRLFWQFDISGYKHKTQEKFEYTFAKASMEEA
jgi:hypothetical protein